MSAEVATPGESLCQALQGLCRPGKTGPLEGRASDTLRETLGGHLALRRAGRPLGPGRGAATLVTAIPGSPLPTWGQLSCCSPHPHPVPEREDFSPSLPAHTCSHRSPPVYVR